MADEDKRPEEEAEAQAPESSKNEDSAAEAETSQEAPAEEAASEETSAEEPASTEEADSDETPQEEAAAAASAQEEPAAHGDHGHGGGHDDEHFAHTASAKMLLGVFGALIFLTVLTVAVTAVDLGANGNLIVAMVIATIKAALVMGFFMHMIWDNKFNVVAFTSSFLFVILFLAMVLTDRGEYQDAMDSWEADKKAEELGM